MKSSQDRAEFALRGQQTVSIVPRHTQRASSDTEGSQSAAPIVSKGFDAVPSAAVSTSQASSARACKAAVGVRGAARWQPLACGWRGHRWPLSCGLSGPRKGDRDPAGWSQGDFHDRNLLWETGAGSVRAVLDRERPAPPSVSADRPIRQEEPQTDLTATTWSATSGHVGSGRRRRPSRRCGRHTASGIEPWPRGRLRRNGPHRHPPTPAAAHPGRRTQQHRHRLGRPVPRRGAPIPAGTSATPTTKPTYSPTSATPTTPPATPAPPTTPGNMPWPSSPTSTTPTPTPSTPNSPHTGTMPCNRPGEYPRPDPHQRQTTSGRAARWPAPASSCPVTRLWPGPGRFSQVVETGAATAPDGPDDVPAAARVLGGEAEGAVCADDESGLGVHSWTAGFRTSSHHSRKVVGLAV